MGRRGPVQQTAAVKIAKGTYQPHQHKPTAESPHVRPDNPFDSTRPAHRAFEQIVAELEAMGTIGRADLSHLIAYAEAFEMREIAYKDLADRGYCYMNDKGVEILNPSFTVWSKATDKLRSLGNDLGTNANARCRIVVGQNKPEKQQDKRLGFIG